MTGQVEDAERAAREVLDAGMNPMRVLEMELFPIMKSVGEKFEKGEYFLTDLMSAADAMRAASRILESKIRAEGRGEMPTTRTGKLVIGTVSGDIHDIGKNIVALLLEVNGFDIDDLGKDVESMKFIERAQELQADIVAVSALMTTTKPAQKEVMDLLNEMRIRDKHVVMVGGAPTSREWADQIGADGWAETADQAVRVAQKLVGKR
jgi:corrinoid protein of di/trimethylamine methyltransferase